MTQIKEALKDFNPHWTAIAELDYKERTIYKTLKKFMQKRQIITLTGLRGVGKTTLMKKIMQDAFEKTPPQNTLFFSFDEFHTVTLRDVLAAYQEILEKDITQDKHLLLFDEIQKLENWQDEIKALYDTHNNCKIVLSGSESLFIRSRSRETLAGRIFQFQVKQLTFKEYLHFRSVSIQKPQLHEHTLRKEWLHFIRTQGFPELVGVKDKEVIQKYLSESIVEKIIFRDFEILGKAKELATMQSLFKIFYEDPGQMSELHPLAQQLGMTRQTIASYIRYLEEAFLLRKLYNFSENSRKTERKLKKYYPSIIAPNLTFSKDTLEQSRVLGWAAAQQLDAEFFWRDNYKHEVGIIIPQSKKPIEVKYGRIDTKGLVAYMKKHKQAHGTILSDNEESEIQRDLLSISIIPLWKYLLEDKSQGASPATPIVSVI